MKKLRLCIIFILLFISFPQIKAVDDDPYKGVAGYKSTKIDRVGRLFYGAVTYNGRVFAVEVGGDLRNYVTLVEIPRDSKTGEVVYDDKKQWVITHGGRYGHAEVVVWNNRIWVFWRNYDYDSIWCKEFYFDESGNGVIGREVEIKVPVNRDPEVSDAIPGDFAVTLYKNYVCVVHHKQDGRLAISYSSDLDLANWTYWGTMKNGTNDNIAIQKYFNYIAPPHDAGINDTWSATNWVGFRNGKESEMLLITRVKSKANDIEVYSYEGDFKDDPNAEKWNWNVTWHGAKGQTFYVKAIQAAVEGFTKENTNPIQIIYASQDPLNHGEVFIREFYPETLSFPEGEGLHNYFDIPYGYYGVTTANIIKDDQSKLAAPYIDYQQILYIIRGNRMWDHWQDSYVTKMNSYVTRVKWDKYGDSGGYFSEPSLRPLIKLIGIVEGPPPTLATEAYYKKMGHKTTGILEMENSSKEIKTTVRNGDVSVNAGMGRDEKEIDKISFSLGIGYEFSKQSESSASFETGTGFKFVTDSKDDNATALMLIPTVKESEFEVYYKGAKNEKYPSGIDVSIVGQALSQVPIPLSGSPFNVSNPIDLSSWYNRPILDGITNLPGNNKIQIGFDVGAQETWGYLSTSLTNTSTNKHKITLSADIKIPIFKKIAGGFFSLGGSASMEFESSTTTVLDNSLKLTLSKILKEDATEDMMDGYTLNLCALNDGNQEITKRYYEKMKGVKVDYRGSTFDLFTESDGTPFILAWDVENINKKKDNHTSGVDDSEINGCKAYAVNGGIKIECADMASVEVINALGMRIVDRKVSNDEVIPVYNGIYIVKVNNNGIINTKKIMVGK